MICQFCQSEIPDTQPFNFCPMCGQTIPSPVTANPSAPGIGTR